MAADHITEAPADRSSLAVRLVGVLGLGLFGAILGLAIIIGVLGSVFGLLIVLFTGGAWAPLLGGG